MTETTENDIESTQTNPGTNEPLLKLPRLRPRVKKFCENILSNMSQVEAYQKAGFSCKNDKVASVSANRLLDNDNVKSYIEIREKQINDDLIKKTNINRIDIVNTYLAIREDSLKHDTPTFKRLAKDTNDSLAKILGLFVEKQETTVKTENSRLDVSKITSDDLAQLSNMLKRINSPVAEPEKVEKQ